MTTEKMGPQMQKAWDYIREHPGCSKLDAMRSITYSRSASPTGYGQDKVIERLIRRGLVRAEHGPDNRYRLYVA